MKIHLPALRLAGLYLAVIMLISLFFSVTIYQLSIHEVYRGFSKQQDVLEQTPELFLPQELRDELLNQRSRQYENIKADILGRLFLVNLAILIAGGFISYYWALRTIRPIEEAREVQSRFTADASHELRTPLAVLQSETEVALMDPKLNLKSAKAQMKSNLEEVSKLINISEGLLQLSQLEDGRLDKKSVELSKIVSMAVKDKRTYAKSKKIKLNLLSNNTKNVYADADALRKILSVLIDNAIKYSQPNSEVKVSSTVRDKNAVIEVEDSGIGIKGSEIKNIFDRFYRADTARTKSDAGGYGLGLSIAKSIIDLHGGAIEVASTPGKKTVFSVILPLP